MTYQKLWLVCSWPRPYPADTPPLWSSFRRRVGKNGRTVSHFMKVSVAVDLLRAQHGAENARKIALQEQHKARRSRSRRRFNFWTDVTTAIGSAKAK